MNISDCPKCGAKLIVEEPPGMPLWIVRCAECGHEGGGVWDPALPPSAEPEDYRDAVLVLDSSGADTKAVAAVLKSHLGITSTEALALAREGRGPLARHPSARVWQLKDFEAAIRQAGGTAHLERVE